MKRRIVYLDMIRIIAAYLVIFTHTGDNGSKLYVYGDYGVIQNTLYMAMDVFRTINVPLFFMVSGALLLGKTETYSQLFKKHILKYTAVITVFSYLYYTVYPLADNNWLDIRGYLKGIYSGNVIGLFWFLYAYLGFLLILPFIRKMIQSMSDIDYKYILITGILFKGIFAVVGGLVFCTGFGVSCTFATDSIFYPIMGYYLAKVIEDRTDKKLLTSGAVLSFFNIICAVLMTYWDMNKNGEYSENYLFSFTVIPALYMFYLLKCIGRKLEKSQFVCKIINCLGNCSFGVYLFGLFIQVVMVKPVYRKIFACLPNFPLLACLVYVAVVVLVAVVITYILKKIPGVRTLL